MDIKAIVEQQRAYFDTGETLSVDTRIDALCRLRSEIKRSERRIIDALAFDLGKSSQESYMCEIGLVLSELRHHIAHIREWAAPKRVRTDAGNFPARSFTIAEPYGVVLVMAPWNYPFMLCMEPLIGAIAAGNCCVVKPSAYAPATSRVVAEIVEAAFDSSYVTAIEGGRAANEALLDQRFDYIFFTGSPAVGKLVMRKAAENLTPSRSSWEEKAPASSLRTPISRSPHDASHSGSSSIAGRRASHPTTCSWSATYMMNSSPCWEDTPQKCTDPMRCLTAITGAS